MALLYYCINVWGHSCIKVFNSGIRAARSAALGRRVGSANPTKLRAPPHGGDLLEVQAFLLRRPCELIRHTETFSNADIFVWLLRDADVHAWPLAQNQMPNPAQTNQRFKTPQQTSRAHAETGPLTTCKSHKSNKSKQPLNQSPEKTMAF